MPDKTDVLKESYRNIACIILQDLIKYKRDDINRYNGLYNTLEQAGIVPLDYKVENVAKDLISQSTDHERKLRTMARHIKCQFVYHDVSRRF